jgi:uncharacterized protein
MFHKNNVLLMIPRYYSYTMMNRFINISTLIVKVTHRCNLDCLYCYEHITKTGEDMSIETFKSLADKVLENSRQPEITFLFHGGEPTILKNEWYEEAIKYVLQKAEGLHKKVNFSMQSNLLHISDSKIDLFRKYNVQLGVSLDSVATSQNTMRGGEINVFENYLKVKKAGIKAGILSTINHSNFDKFDVICDFLVNEAHVSFFKANVVTSVGRGFELPSLQPEQIFEAQHAILNYMIRTEGKKLLEHNLMVEIKRFFGERENLPPTLCHEKKCGAGTSVLGVTPHGDLLPCGRFQWNDSEYFLGHLEESDNHETNPFEHKLTQFQNLVPQSWFDCDGCPAKKVCGFGCQAFIVRSKEQANVDCLPTKMRFAFYQKNQKKLLPVYHSIQEKEICQGENRSFQIKDNDGNIKSYTFSPKQNKSDNWLRKTMKNLKFV